MYICIHMYFVAVYIKDTGFLPIDIHRFGISKNRPPHVNFLFPQTHQTVLYGARRAPIKSDLFFFPLLCCHFPTQTKASASDFHWKMFPSTSSSFTVLILLLSFHQSSSFSFPTSTSLRIPQPVFYNRIDAKPTTSLHPLQSIAVDVSVLPSFTRPDPLVGLVVNIVFYLGLKVIMIG